MENAANILEGLLNKILDKREPSKIHLQGLPFRLEPTSGFRVSSQNHKTFLKKLIFYKFILF